MMEHEEREVRQAQAGDAAAFARLSAHYRGWLLAMAFLRTGHREDAEDLVQEVLARAWEKLPALEAPAAFAGWLQRILINAGCSRRREHGHCAASLDEIPVTAPAAQDPPHLLLARERQRALRAALFALAPANRLALLMHLWGDYSYADIAHLLRIPVSTVDGRIYRAKQQLRRQLREEFADLFNEPRRQWRGKKENP